MAGASLPGSSTQTSLTLHASCVVHLGRAALITGASGSGKSGLALQLIAMGAGLVADDRTCLTRDGQRLVASVPAQIEGLIEARQVGLLRCPVHDPSDVALVIDMDTAETERLPPWRETVLLGLKRPLLRKSAIVHFPAAILTYLSGGRHA